MDYVLHGQYRIHVKIQSQKNLPAAHSIWEIHTKKLQNIQQNPKHLICDEFGLHEQTQWDLKFFNPVAWNFLILLYVV